MHSDNYDTNRARVRILATSDIHMNLTGFDYYSDTPDPSIGFTRTASLIRAARREAEQTGSLVLLFDNGDSLQGTPLGDHAAEGEALHHPLAAAFRSLGYDAAGLGNHDFGFGLKTLGRILDQMPCPVVCSNMAAPDPAWQRQAILTREVLLGDKSVPLRIGVLSLLPPQVAQWEAHKLEGGANVSDIVETGREVAANLRRDGCDLVIALAHTGLGSPRHVQGMENAAIPLAALPDIDVVIAGHTHQTLPGDAHDGLQHVDAARGLVHGKPVVMQGWAGTHLGVIDLTLEHQNGFRIASCRTDVRPIAPEDPAAEPVAEDSDLLTLFSRAHAETRARVARPVGQVSRRLHSYFSFCARDHGLALVAAAQAAALRPYLDGGPFADLPLISAVAPAKFGARAGPGYYTDVPAGGVSVRHVADLHVFPNELRAVIATGAQLRDWLEMSACVFNTLSTAHTAELINPQRTGHNFDVLHGLSCRFDLSQNARFDTEGQLTAPGSFRVRNLTLNGDPVDPDQRFVVATNNYRVNGGGHFPISVDPQLVVLPGLRVHDAICDYLAGQLPRDPLEDAPQPFGFAPLGCAQAMLRTGPRAADLLEELDTFNPVPEGRSQDGFLTIRLTL